MCLSILEISLVMSRNCHNRTCTIACKNEITDKHAHFPAVYRVDTMKSLKLTARLCLVEFCTIHIALLDRLIYISLNLFFVLDSVHKSFYNVSVRSKNHECDTVDCLDTCSKDRKLSAANYLEFDLDTGTLSDPVSLHLFCRLRPVDLVKPLKKFLCKCRLVDNPLFHVLSDYRISSTL